MKKVDQKANRREYFPSSLMFVYSLVHFLREHCHLAEAKKVTEPSDRKAGGVSTRLKKQAETPLSFRALFSLLQGKVSTGTP